MSELKRVGLQLTAEGAQDYQSALKGCANATKEARSELKLAQSGYDNNTTATKKLTDQQKYLTQMTESYTQKVQVLSSQLEEMKNDENANADAISKKKSQLDTAQASLNNYKSKLDDVTASIKTHSAELKEWGSKLQSVGDKMSTIGGTLTKTVTAGVAGIGVASYAAWKEVDEGLDTVTTKTGATGDALSAMQDSVQNITTEIPVSFNDAGSAIGEVNTKLGLTGQALEDTSSQFLKFAQINDTDVTTSVDNVQKILASFGLKAEDAGSILDTLNSVSQKTGISVDSLSQDLSQNAAQLKEMGMSADESAQFLGSVEMSGLDTSTAMTGLKKAMKAATDEGVSLDSALSGFSTTMASNKSDTEKLQAAYDLFGQKAGGAIYNACSTGTLSFNDLSQAATESGDSVSKTFEETQDPADKMTTTMNQLKEVGYELFQTVGPMLADIMTDLSGILKDAKDGWDGLDDGQQEFIVKAALVGAAVGPVISVFGTMVTTIGKVTSGVGDLVGKLGSLGTAKTSVDDLGTSINNVKTGGGLSSFLKTDITSLDSLSSKLGAAGLAVGTFAASFEFTTAILQVTGLDEKLKELGATIYDVTHKTQEQAAQASTDALAVVDAYRNGSATAQEAVTALRDAAVNATENERTSFNNLADTIEQTAGTTSSSAASMSTSMSGMSTNLAKSVGESKAQLGNLETQSKTTTKNVTATFAGMKIEIPKIKMPHFSISGSFSLNPPSVPSMSVSWYRKAMDNGMVLNSPTIFGMSGGKLLAGGEAGSEAVVGTESLKTMITNAVTKADNSISLGDVTIQIYQQAGENIDELVERIEEELNDEVLRRKAVTA
ncbi:MAG: phage tail tape measure protein [Prevotella sp.]